MIECLAGLPGKGKGVLATFRAIKYHRSPFAKKALKEANTYLPEDNQLETLVFSNYPILLDRKREIYSNYIDFEHLTIEEGKCFQLPSMAYVIIDEAQRHCESRNFQSFSGAAATFLQAHRHGGIHRILMIAQDPGRLDTQVRNLCETYTQIVSSRYKFGVGFMRTHTYYRYEDYGKPCPSKTVFTKVPTQALAGGYYDYDKRVYLFLTGRVFNSYDTKYFRFFFDRMPVLPYRKYTDKTFTAEEIIEFGLDRELNTRKKRV